jgi:hypothetical protein
VRVPEAEASGYEVIELEGFLTWRRTDPESAWIRFGLNTATRREELRRHLLTRGAAQEAAAHPADPPPEEPTSRRYRHKNRA